MSVATLEAVSLEESPRVDQAAFWAADLDYVHAVFAQMRAEEPVYWHEPGGFWIVTRYDDQQEVRRQANLFSSESGFLLQHNFDPASLVAQLPEWAQGPILSGKLSRAESRKLIAKATLSMGEESIEQLISTDPPRHSEIRRILTAAMSQRWIRNHRPMCEHFADDALDRLVPGERCDFVEAVSARIPANMMAEMLGVDASDNDRFLRGADAFTRQIDITPDTDLEVAAHLAELTADFVVLQRELIEKRRKDPGDDVVSKIVQAELDGEPITDDRALVFTQSLITAGSDTTKHLLSTMVYALAAYPEQREILRERPELVPNAIDEILRFYPVAWHQTRTATEDTEIRGVKIKKDDFILLPIPSANRDETVWEDPHTFDVTRHFDREHQAFGWGPHLCPGGNLSRLEARVVLAKMLERFSGWEVTDEPERFTAMALNGYQTMFVRCFQ